MQCSCGAETRDHETVEKGVVVAKYAQCVTCGRVMFWFDHRPDKKAAPVIGEQIHDR